MSVGHLVRRNAEYVWFIVLPLRVNFSLVSVVFRKKDLKAYKSQRFHFGSRSRRVIVLLSFVFSGQSLESG